MCEYDYLWLHQWPKNEIAVGPVVWAILRLAGNLGVPMDDAVPDSELKCDYRDDMAGAKVLRIEHLWKSYGQRGKGGARRVYCSMERDLFVVSMSSVIGRVVEGVGTVKPKPASDTRGAVQVLPELLRTPQYISSSGGERQGTIVVVEDVDMGTTDIRWVAPALVTEGTECGCNCCVVLVGVEWKSARGMWKMREEVIR